MKYTLLFIVSLSALAPPVLAEVKGDKIVLKFTHADGAGLPASPFRTDEWN